MTPSGTTNVCPASANENVSVQTPPPHVPAHARPHAPQLLVSVATFRHPPSHVWPPATVLVQPFESRLGAQNSQALFAGFAAPGGTMLPSMSQPVVAASPPASGGAPSDASEFPVDRDESVPASSGSVPSVEGAPVSVACAPSAWASVAPGPAELDPHPAKTNAAHAIARTKHKSTIFRMQASKVRPTPRAKTSL